MDVEECNRIIGDYDSRVSYMAVTSEELQRMDNLLKDEKYQQNLKDLELYKDSYAEEFLKLKEKFELSLNRMENEVSGGILQVCDNLAEQNIELDIELDKELMRQRI